MDRETLDLLPAIFEENGWTTNGEPRAASNVVTKKVCAECNNGWMKDLEDGVAIFLRSLVVKNRKSFSPVELQISGDECEILKRWLLKTAICMNLTCPEGAMEKYPQEAPQWTYLDDLPKTLVVFGGWIAKSDVGIKILRGYRGFNGGKFIPNMKHAQSFDISLQLNHLSIRMLNAPGADYQPMPYRNREGEFPMPLFLSHNHPKEYMPDSCTYECLDDFSKAFYVMVNSGEISELEMRRAIESARRFLP